MKTAIRRLMCLSLIVTGAFLSNEAQGQASQAGYKQTWESVSNVEATPEWFKDAKFGIYTHWGPTSVAFEGMEENQRLPGWHGMHMWGKKGSKRWQTGTAQSSEPSSNYKHHVKQFGNPQKYGYDYIIDQFKPTGFDAKEWAELFALSGAKFAGPVAMHHDNFAMWDSKATRWNSMNYGGVDISAELKREVEELDMKFMASFHHAFTWAFFAQAYDFKIDPSLHDLYGEPREFGAEVSDAFLASWWAKLKEYIDTYQPDMIWFDWWLENFPEEERLKFLAYYYNKGLEWNKEVAVCYKEATFTQETAINDYERGRPNQIVDPAWLTDTSPGTWFYRSNAKFVEANELIDILVDIVAKNGCMLLNVPPDPDGTIPDEMKKLLTEMGAWLQVNGEAIYATRTWDIFGEGPTRLPSGGHKIEEKAKIEYGNTDVRFTKKSDTEFYAIVLDKPDEQLSIKSLSTYIGLLNSNIQKIELLGSDEEIKWERNADGLIINAPTEYPTEHAHAFKIILGAYQEADIDGEID
ncbi:MAG: alpha-L-fucosidase [Cyclobacteriaceae bacterium]